MHREGWGGGGVYSLYNASLESSKQDALSDHPALLHCVHMLYES